MNEAQNRVCELAENNFKISYAEMEKRWKICGRCKHCDSKSDIPTIWCNKNTEILNCFAGDEKTYTFTYQKKCPIEKF